MSECGAVAGLWSECPAAHCHRSRMGGGGEGDVDGGFVLYLVGSI